MEQDCDVVNSIKAKLSTINRKLSLKAMQSEDKKDIYIQVEGSLKGKSYSYARRVRRQVFSTAQNCARRARVSVSVDYLADDAIGRLQQAITGVVRAHIESSVAAFVRDVNEYTFDIDIDVGDHLPMECSDKCFNLLQDIAMIGGARIRHLHYVNTANRLPSRPAILRAVKILQPCSVSTIERYLCDIKVVVPGNGWLQRMVDCMRREGLLESSSSDDVSLSGKAFEIIGASRSRKSPDILRALYIARRTW